MVATQFNNAKFAMYCSSLWGGGGGAGSVKVELAIRAPGRAKKLSKCFARFFWI